MDVAFDVTWTMSIYSILNEFDVIVKMHANMVRLNDSPVVQLDSDSSPIPNASASTRTH